MIPTKFFFIILFSWLVMFALLLAGSNVVQAQNANPQSYFNLKQMVPTSPEAALLGRFGDIPIGYYTGTANISVPIYTIKEAGLELPIQLQYHSSGIRVEDEASTVGLGWLLEPGGAIIHVINGLPDRKDNFAITSSSDYAYLKSHVAVQGVIQSRTQNGTNSFLCSAPSEGDSFNSMESLVQGYGQPDIYIYNFPGGYSGKFYIDPESHQITLIDKKDQIWFQATQNGWMATTIDGHRFYFETAEEVIPGGDSWQTSETWKLTKVVLNNNKTINFEYEKGTYWSQSYNENFHSEYPLEEKGSETTAPLPGSTDYWVKVNISPTEHHVMQLNKITCGDVVVDFKLESRDDISLKRVGSVNISSKRSGKVLKTVKFNYDYFNGSVLGGDFTNPNYDPMVDTSSRPDNLKKRLKLVSVQETGYSAAGDAKLNPPYEFSYEESEVLPLKTSYARDFWGYYNGKNNKKLIPDLNYFYYSGLEAASMPYWIIDWVKGANRSPDKTKMTMGMLKQVKYPSGGFAQFSYESNDFSNFNLPDVDKVQSNQRNINLDDKNTANSITSAFFKIPLQATVKFTLTFNRGYPGPGGAPILFTDMQDARINLYQVVNGTETALKTWTLNIADRTTYEQNGAVTYTPTYEFSSAQVKSSAQFKLQVDLPDRLGDQSAYDRQGSVGAWFTYYDIPVSTSNLSFGAGVRVAAIKLFDASGDVISHKKLIYKNEDQTSSGKLMSPVQYVTRHNLHAEVLRLIGPPPDPSLPPDDPANIRYYQISRGDREVWFVSSESFTPFSNAAGGNLVGYSRVEELELAGSGETNGKHVYTYHNQESSVGVGVPDNPSLLNGMVRSEEFYDRSGNKLKEVFNEYSSLKDSTIMGFKATKNIIVNFECQPPRKVYQYPSNTYLIQEYPINSKWYRLKSSITTDYRTASPIKTTTTYAYNDLGQLAENAVLNSKGENLGSKYIYPYDKTSRTATEQSLIDLSFYNHLLEQRSLNNNKETSLTKISYGIVDNQLVRTAIDQSNNQQSLSREATFDHYGPNMTLTQVSMKGILPNALLWDQTNSYMIAQIKNARMEDVAYTSFEYGDNRGWSFVGNGSFGITAKTGAATFDLSWSSVKASGLTPAKTYIISYWSQGGAYTVTGSSYTKGATVNGWTYYEHVLSGQSAAEVSGKGRIDELRLYPKDAEMTTYTYDPLVGMTSQTNARGETTTYEYDEFQRLKTIRDSKGQIIKQMDYHYQNQ